MVINNTDSGGQTVYTRTYDTQTAQFTATQVQTNAAGAVVYDFKGQQSSLDAPLVPVNSSVVNNNQTTSQTWHGNGVYQTDTFMGPPAPNTSPSSSSMTIGQVNYNLLDINQRTHAQYQFTGLKYSGAVSEASYNFFTQNNSYGLLGSAANDRLWQRAA